jgi:enamine deaminase RidA (YjgF/YER057c/UK114 family)
MTTQRRNALKKIFASIAGTVGLGYLAKAETAMSATSKEKEVFNVVKYDDQDLYSSVNKYNGLLYLAGIGAHFAGDIKSHTDHVLKEMQKQLEGAGSSMEKVLQVNVFLNDIADYKGMNEVFKGRFGSKPPVRTTVAVAKGGVPGDSLVEMNCIAYT